MEIPLASDFAQASALFTDSNENERRREILGLWPNELPNKHLESLDLVTAVSVSNLDKEFRTNDYKEAYRLYNGALQYPFQNKAQIFHHKFDPFYWDGSELDGDYNVQENLIGTPLGASTLEDPRMTYVANILQMKELHGANDPLDNAYLQNLYMLNTDKGSNYYQNQLQKLNFAMNQHTRVSKAARHVPLHSIQFSKNLATGNPVHIKHTAKRKISMPSAAGLQQTSRKQSRMTALDQNKPAHVVKAAVPTIRRPTDASSFSDSADDFSIAHTYHDMTGPTTGFQHASAGDYSNGVFGGTNEVYENYIRARRGAITLPIDPQGHQDLANDGQSVYTDEASIMTSLGDGESVSVPHTMTQEMALLNTPGDRTATASEAENFRREILGVTDASDRTLSPEAAAKLRRKTNVWFKDLIQEDGNVTVHSEATQSLRKQEAEQWLQTPMSQPGFEEEKLSDNLSTLTQTPFMTPGTQTMQSSESEPRRINYEQLEAARGLYSSIEADMNMTSPNVQTLVRGLAAPSKYEETPLGVNSLFSENITGPAKPDRVDVAHNKIPATVKFVPTQNIKANIKKYENINWNLQDKEWAQQTGQTDYGVPGMYYDSKRRAERFTPEGRGYDSIQGEDRSVVSSSGKLRLSDDYNKYLGVIMGDYKEHFKKGEARVSVQELGWQKR
jgi:hypothetical protein